MNYSIIDVYDHSENGGNHRVLLFFCIKWDVLVNWVKEAEKKVNQSRTVFHSHILMKLDIVGETLKFCS
jgi:hypothetical protein